MPGSAKRNLYARMAKVEKLALLKSRVNESMAKVVLGDNVPEKFRASIGDFVKHVESFNHEEGDAMIAWLEKQSMSTEEVKKLYSTFVEKRYNDSENRISTLIPFLFRGADLQEYMDSIESLQLASRFVTLWAMSHAHFDENTSLYNIKQFAELLKIVLDNSLAEERIRNRLQKSTAGTEMVVG